MPNLNWNNLSSMQLGMYAEYYAKMELTSYRFEVYTSEVDDHGVDFITRKPGMSFYEIQVKSLYKSNYAYIPKTKMDIKDSNRVVCFIHFRDGVYPIVYLIPAVAWKCPNAVLVDRKYDKAGQKGPPEWGIYFTEKNSSILEEYKVEKSVLSVFK